MRRQPRARPPRRRPGDAMHAALLPPRNKEYPPAKTLSHLLIHFLYLRPGSPQIPFNLVSQEVVSDLRRRRLGRRWMSTDSQLLLTAWYERRDFEARRRLIEAAPAARARARKPFRSRGEQLEDLVQVGSVGLIKAVDRYDPRRGSSLTAYAVPTIVGEIRRHLRDGTQPLRVPRAQRALSPVQAVPLEGQADLVRDTAAERRFELGEERLLLERGLRTLAQARAAHRSAALLRRAEPAADRGGARALAGARFAPPAPVAGQATRRNRPNVSRDITLRVLCG